MLDLSLTEEERNIRDLAHDFAEQEIRPVAWEYDGMPLGRRRSSIRLGRLAL